MQRKESLSEWQGNVLSSMSHLKATLTAESLVKIEKYVRRCNPEAPPADFADELGKLMKWRTMAELEEQHENLRPEWRKQISALRRIAGRKGSLDADRAIILGMVRSEAREIVSAIDPEEWLAQFEEWFLVLKARPPGPQIQSVMVALTELTTGFDVCPFGTNRYMGIDKDSNWYDWNPQMAFSGFRGASGLWRKLEKVGEEAWGVMLGLMMAITKEFFARRAREFQEMSGLKSPSITICFVGGDLYELPVK
jgi:hypothetical protein